MHMTFAPGNNTLIIINVSFNQQQIHLLYPIIACLLSQARKRELSHNNNIIIFASLETETQTYLRLIGDKHDC